MIERELKSNMSNRVPRPEVIDEAAPVASRLNSDKTLTYAGKVMTYVSTAQTLFNLGRQVKSWYDNRNTYLITIPSTDMVYNHVHKWLASMLDQRSITHITVDTRWNADDEPEANFLLSGEDSRTAVYNGHKITFSLEEPANKPIPADTGYVSTVQKLYITTYSAQGFNAVTEKIKTLAATHYEMSHPARVHVYMKYGWQSQEQPLRPLSSVVLKDGMAEKISQDIKLFLDSESAYNERGIPWHRGYIFDGPPGSGKTSLAKGLANEFNLDLYFLPVSDLKDDAELMGRVREVPSRSILLLEDVDTVSSMTDRDAEGVTMSGMLNVLDGVATPHGLITLLTTNHKEKIDSAILRPGRVDLHLHVGHPDKEQATRLFETFFKQAPSGVIDPRGHSTAELTEVFKQYLHDPEGAERALLDLDD